MEKQYHAWDWHTLAQFSVTAANLDHLIWDLQCKLGETHRMLNQRDDDATTDEEINIVNADTDRLYEIEERLEQAEEAVENLYKIRALIEAIGTPPEEEEEEDSDEPGFDVWEIADMAQALYPEAR